MDARQRIEVAVLNAVRELGRPYGVPLRRRMNELLGEDVAYGEMYAAIDRLAKKGYVTTEQADPTPIRGERPRCYVEITKQGEFWAKACNLAYGAKR